jgi:hypothetical protein
MLMVQYRTFFFWEPYIQFLPPSEASSIHHYCIDTYFVLFIYIPNRRFHFHRLTQFSLNGDCRNSIIMSSISRRVQLGSFRFFSSSEMVYTPIVSDFAPLYYLCIRIIIGSSYGCSPCACCAARYIGMIIPYIPVSLKRCVYMCLSVGATRVDWDVVVAVFFKERRRSYEWTFPR